MIRLNIGTNLNLLAIQERPVQTAGNKGESSVHRSAEGVTVLPPIASASGTRSVAHEVPSALEIGDSSRQLHLIENRSLEISPGRNLAKAS